jgi:hypothetical protein
MGTCHDDEATIGLFGRAMQRDRAIRKATWLHRVVKRMTSVTIATGRIGEEPNYAILEVLSIARNEHGSWDTLAGIDPSATRASLLPVPVFDFFLDGVRAHVVGLDFEDFAIG